MQSVERILLCEGMGTLPSGGHPAHDRQVVGSLFLVDDRRLPLGSVRPNQPRQEVKPPIRSPKTSTRRSRHARFRNSGQTLARHRLIAGSSRWMARRIGI